MSHIARPVVIAVMAGGLLTLATPASADVQDNTVRSTQTPISETRSDDKNDAPDTADDKGPGDDKGAGDDK